MTNLRSVLIRAGKSIILSAFLTLIFILLFSIIIFLHNGKNSYYSACCWITFIIGVLSTGFFMGKNQNNKGWLMGIYGGMVYFVVCMLITLGTYLRLDLNLVIKTFILSLAIGLIGGIIGINFGSSKK